MALCVRDHLQRGSHLHGCTDGACRGCAPALATFGQLCVACFGRIRDRLEAAPEIAAHLRLQMVPGGGGGGSKVQGGRDESPLPIRINPLEDSAALYSRLGDWVTYYARELTLEPPRPFLAAFLADENVGSMPVGASPEYAHHLVSQAAWFLRAHLPDIATLDSVQALHDDVDEMIFTLLRRYRLNQAPSRRYRRRPCPVCLVPAVTVSWPDAETVLVRCQRCGADLPLPEQALVEDIIAQMKSEQGG